MNKVEPTKKIQVTMEVATDTLEFLDLKLKCDEESKQISVDVFAKDNGSFTYVLPSTCFPKNNIENIPKGVPLRLRRICNSDEKLEKHSAEYENYLIARGCKPGTVKKEFSDIKKILQKRQVKTIIRDHLPILYGNQQMLDIFCKTP